MVCTVNKSIYKLMKFFGTLHLLWWGQGPVMCPLSVSSCISHLFFTQLGPLSVATASKHPLYFTSLKTVFSCITLYRQQQKAEQTEEVDKSAQFHPKIAGQMVAPRIVRHIQSLTTVYLGAETSVGGRTRQENLNWN